MHDTESPGIEEALAAEKARADREANRAAEMEAEANREQARADAAGRMLAECVALLGDVKRAEFRSIKEGLGASPFWGEEWQQRIDAILDRPEVTEEALAAERARSHALRRMVAECVARAMEQFVAERDAALADAQRARDEADALGIQLVALRERLRLADALAEHVAILDETWRDLGNNSEVAIYRQDRLDILDAWKAYRAVPGDVKKGGG